MPEKLRDKKILYGLLLFFFLVVIPLVSYALLKDKFKVKEFKDVVEVNYQSDFKEASGEVCYGNFFNCNEVTVSKEGEVDTSKIGEYTVKYTYEYEGQKFFKEQKIEVKDLEAPHITLEDENITVCPNGKLRQYNVKAEDNYDQDVNDKITTKYQNGKVIFEVTDKSGNKATLEKEATLKDEDKPLITLKGESVVSIKAGDKYEELGATATDECDGDLTDKISVESKVDTNTPGEYEVSYKVMDSSQNEANIKRKVYVYKQNNPSAPAGKSIYLTFDDGPSYYTSKLLDVLKKYNVKATFFVTSQGLTSGYDDVILRAYQEGHTIGLHSYSHNYNIYTSENTYFNDLYAIQNKVKKITGYTANIIRFPGGSSNTISKSYDGGSHIMSTLTKAVEVRGFRYFDWNVASGDAGETTNTATVISNVIGALGNNNTYMVLQHDIKGFSVDAVESIIEFGLSHGYTFRAITSDTPTVHHRVNN